MIHTKRILLIISIEKQRTMPRCDWTLPDIHKERQRESDRERIRNKTKRKKILFPHVQIRKSKKDKRKDTVDIIDGKMFVCVCVCV